MALAAAVLMACTDDSQPLGPEAPGGMEAAPSPTASIKGWAGSAPMPTKRLGLVAASVNGIVYTIGGQSEFLAGDARRRPDEPAIEEPANPGRVLLGAINALEIVERKLGLGDFVEFGQSSIRFSPMGGMRAVKLRG